MSNPIPGRYVRIDAEGSWEQFNVHEDGTVEPGAWGSPPCPYYFRTEGRSQGTWRLGDLLGPTHRPLKELSWDEWRRESARVLEAKEASRR